jgi:streptogramin lyase
LGIAVVGASLGCGWSAGVTSARNPLNLELQVVSGVPSTCTSAGVPTVASDGALWVICGRQDLRISPQGAVTAAYRIPDGIDEVLESLPGEDGAVWYPGTVFDRPFRGPWCLVTPLRGFRCAALHQAAGSFTSGAVVDRSGSLCLFETGPGWKNLDEVSTSLRVARHPVPSSLDEDSGGLIAAPDGALWFSSATSLTRVTPSFGFQTRLAIDSGQESSLRLVTANGDFFYTGSEPGGDELAGTMTRLTPAGKATTITVPTPIAEPIVGPEHDVWVVGWSTMRGPGRLVRVSPGGRVRTFPLPRGSRATKFGFGLGDLLWSQQLESGAIDTISDTGGLTPVSLPGGKWQLAAIAPHALWLTKRGSDPARSAIEIAVVRARR